MSREISSIIRASRILKCLSQGICKITDIANELELSKGTVHGILETLVSTDFAGQDPASRQYCLGPLFFQLTSNPLITHNSLILCSYDEMKKLRDLSEETVAIMVPNGSQKITLEELPSTHSLRYSGGKGLSTPLYIGAPGKILLSEFEQKRLNFFIKNIDLAPVTANTITEKGTLLNELETIRKNGFSTSFGERLPGSSCIAVPVKGYFCPVSLSIIGPENRFPLEKIRSISVALQQGAINISQKIEGVFQGKN